MLMLKDNVFRGNLDTVVQRQQERGRLRVPRQGDPRVGVAALRRLRDRQVRRNRPVVEKPDDSPVQPRHDRFLHAVARDLRGMLPRSIL